MIKSEHIDDYIKQINKYWYIYNCENNSNIKSKHIEKSSSYYNFTEMKVFLIRNIYIIFA